MLLDIRMVQFLLRSVRIRLMKLRLDFQVANREILF